MATMGVGMVMAIASTVMQVASRVQQGKAQKAAYQHQAQVAEHQAKLAERDAEAKRIQAGQERASAQREALAEKERSKQVEGRAKSLLAAGGGALDDPTSLNILSDIEERGEYDARVALFQGEDAARRLIYGADTDVAQAGGYRASAAASRVAGKAASRQSYLSAAATLFGGASNIYDKFVPKKTPKPTSSYEHPYDLDIDYR